MQKLPIALLTTLLILGLTAQVFPAANASTNVNGILIKDTVWTKLGSPYVLSGNFTVAKGASLSIQPGVEVNLAGHTFTVDGLLRVQGDAERVYFRNGELDFTYFSDPWVESAETGCLLQNAVLNQTRIYTLNPIRLADVVSDGEVVVNYEKTIITRSNIDELSIYGGTCYIGQDTIREFNLVWGSPTVDRCTIENFTAGLKSSGLPCGALIEYNTIKNVAGSGSSPVFWGNTVNGGITYTDGQWPTVAYNLFNGSIVVSAVSPWIYNNTVLNYRGNPAGIDVNHAAPLAGSSGDPVIVDNTIYCLSGDSVGIAMGGDSGCSSVGKNLIVGGLTGIAVYDAGFTAVSDNKLLFQNASAQSTALSVQTSGCVNALTNLVYQCQNGLAASADVSFQAFNNTFVGVKTAVTVASDSNVTGNNFLNCQLALKVLGNQKINASANWWETRTQTVINQQIQKPADAEVNVSAPLSAFNRHAANVTFTLNDIPEVAEFPVAPPTQPPPSGPQISLFCHTTALSPPATQIQGTLTASGAALPMQAVTLSYDYNLSGAFQPLGVAQTDSSGVFSFDWAPEQNGYYTVKADWTNGGYATSESVYYVLAVVDGEYLSVASNSSVSLMHFTLATQKLYFTLDGTKDSVGYTEVTVPKTVLADAEKLALSMDDTPVVYSLVDKGQNWQVSFSYYQGKREVVINLAVPSGLVESMQGTLILVAAIVAPAVLVAAVYAVDLKRKKTHAPKEETLGK